MEFEIILLKSLLFNSEFFGKVMPILQKKYFVDLGNQELFSILKNHYSSYKITPSLTEVIATIKNVPNEILRKSIITQIQKVSKVQESHNLDFMLDETVKFIKDAIFTEALILGSDALTEKNETKKIKSKALMEEMSKVSIDSDLGLDFDNIEEMIKYYQEKLIGIKTQHTELNKRLGTGFLPKTLSVICAASGVGKSLLMTDLISGHIKDNKNILLVSMEMSDKETMKRVHANVLDFPINDLKEVDPNSIRNKYNEVKSSGKLFIKEYPNGTFSALMLEQLIESYKIEKGIEFDIVYLDYLGIMKSDLVTPSAGLYSYIKSIVEEVRAVSIKKEIPIVSASQLGRAAFGNTEAGNENISDSVGTVQTADFICFLLQTDSMKEDKKMTVKVTKNRFTGITDSWDMDINYSRMRFSDCLVQKSTIGEKECNDIIDNTMRNEIIAIKNKQNSLTEDFSEDEIMNFLDL